MNSALTRTSRSVVIAAAWGILGGVFLVTGHAWGVPQTRASLMFLVFASVVIGSAVSLRRAGSRPRRFALGLGAFMLAALTLYLYIGVVVNPIALNLSVWDHAWRLIFMLALGALATGAALVLGAGIRALGGGSGASPNSKAEPTPRRERPTDTDGFLRRTTLSGRVGPDLLPRS